MIGCAVIKNGIIDIMQFLAQQKSEEEQLLDQFFSLVRNYGFCISFNGDGFDIPFLQDKAKKYHKKDLFSELTSFDLYKQVKPLQSILKLENLKQKTIEQFLGIHRKDMFHGGELISHFFEYEQTKDPSQEDLLLLHNYEDILGLVYLLPIQSYLQPLKGNYHFKESTRTTSKDYYGNSIESLLINASLDHPVPKPASYSRDPYYLSMHENHFKINVRVIDDKIYVPYPDYKNYYYLEKEDMAVLKELASHVEKKDRKPATPATAYGKFLLTQDNLKSAEIFQPYMKQVFDVLVNWK